MPKFNPFCTIKSPGELLKLLNHELLRDFYSLNPGKGAGIYIHIYIYLFVSLSVFI